MTFGPELTQQVDLTVLRQIGFPFDLYKAELELLQPMLGTVARDPETQKKWVKEKQKDRLKREYMNKGIPLYIDGAMVKLTDAIIDQLVGGELKGMPEVLEDVANESWTTFHNVNVEGADWAILYDYQIKGFLKASAKDAREIKGVKQMYDKVHRFVWPHERINFLMARPEGDYERNERPIQIEDFRAPGGVRSALARSDTVPAGTRILFHLTVLREKGGGDQLTQDIITWLLVKGLFRGLGQWRSGGWGRFKCNTLALVESTFDPKAVDGKPIKKRGKKPKSDEDEEAEDEAEAEPA